MFSGLLIILLPLIVGYLFRCVRNPHYGLSTVFSAGLFTSFFFLWGSAWPSWITCPRIYSPFCIIQPSRLRLFCCAILPHCCGWNVKFPGVPSPPGKAASRIAMASESLKLCGVVLRFLLGLTGWAFLQHATEASEYT